MTIFHDRKIARSDDRPLGRAQGELRSKRGYLGVHGGAR